MGLLLFSAGGLGQGSIELSQSAPDMMNLIPKLGDAPPPLVDPEGYFSVVVSPRYFACKTAPKSLECVGLLPVQANLTVKVTDVPKEATVELIGLNQLESVEMKTRFQKLSSQKTAIDGMDAMIQTFTYDNLNNVSLPVWVQFINVLQPKKLVVLQVTCASRDCSEYGPALTQIQQTFRMTPLLKNGQPDRKKVPGPKSGAQQDFSNLVKELEK